MLLCIKCFVLCFREGEERDREASVQVLGEERLKKDKIKDCDEKAFKFRRKKKGGGEIESLSQVFTSPHTESMTE